MKILFYADTVFGVGGVQRVLAQVAQHLSLRHEVTILTNLTATYATLSFGLASTEWGEVIVEKEAT